PCPPRSSPPAASRARRWRWRRWPRRRPASFSRWFATARRRSLPEKQRQSTLYAAWRTSGRTSDSAAHHTALGMGNEASFVELFRASGIGVLGSDLQVELLKALRSIPSREHATCFFGIDLLHQHAFLPVRQVRLALARWRDKTGRGFLEAQGIV